MRPSDLPSAYKLGSGKPHGTRMRYLAGCKCPDCLKANCAYAKARYVAKIHGDWNGLVPAGRARKHLRKLARQGVGRRSVADASDVAKTVLQEIKNGMKKQIRARTERNILAVDIGARGGAAIVPADRTWVRIRRLLREGFSKAELARRMGFNTPALQIHPTRITAKTAMRVERLYRKIMEE